MNRKNRHKKKESDLLEQSAALFERTRIPFKRSREEVWQELAAQLQEIDPDEQETRYILPVKKWIALAASVALLLAAAAFMRLFQEQTVCPPGEHATLQLPDGSLAELNARTTLTYHPLWWPLSKRIDMEGEAFFNVKKGKNFRVVTALGATEVLGTTFNVYARDDQFRVTCHSGRIRVTSSASKHTITLSHDEKAELNTSGEFKVSNVKVERLSPGWKHNLLMFTSTPLRLVFDEIERRYGILIKTPEDMRYIYSGNFALDASVEKVLSLICRPFDLVYEQTSESEYHIYPSAVD